MDLWNVVQTPSKINTHWEYAGWTQLVSDTGGNQGQAFHWAYILESQQILVNKCTSWATVLANEGSKIDRLACVVLPWVSEWMILPGVLIAKGLRKIVSIHCWIQCEPRTRSSICLTFLSLLFNAVNDGYIVPLLSVRIPSLWKPLMRTAWSQDLYFCTVLVYRDHMVQVKWLANHIAQQKGQSGSGWIIQLHEVKLLCHITV